MSSGANVEAVQRMLDHASAAMTLDVHSGFFGDDLSALAERMDAAHDEGFRGGLWTPVGRRLGSATPAGHDHRADLRLRV